MANNWVLADTDRMYKERVRRGWTSRDVARRARERGLRLDFSTYARIESGATRPMLRSVHAIATALDLEVEDLLMPEETLRSAS